MYVTCSFCYKVLSISTKVDNYHVYECPLCGGVFSINLNAMEVMDSGQTWVKAPETTDRFPEDFYSDVGDA